MKKSQVIRIREIIVKAMDGTIDDATALEVPNLFNKWSGDSVAYEVNIRVVYDGILYKCLSSHTSQPTWNPADSPSLWTKVLIPDENIIPDWEQPDSTNGYQYGDKVKHNGKIWISIFNGSNVWEPGTVGTESMWKEYIEDNSEDNTESEDGSSNTDNKDSEVTDDVNTSIAAWVQPDSTNGYSIGDKVAHNGFIWMSKLDNNVYEPSESAWAAWDKVV